MHRLTSRGKQQRLAAVSQFPIEMLENRRLLSGSPVAPFDTTDSPVAALDLNSSAGKKLNGEVGTWTTPNLPAKSSGVVAIALVDWGDGKTSRVKFVDDGSGVIQITGSHAWRNAGTFQTVVKVEEYPKGHAKELSVIGQGDGSAVVTPKPHKLSIKGTLTGTYSTPLGNPDARSYQFTGAGTAGAMGAVNASGTITPPGFIRSAPSTGQFTLTTPGGTITFDVTGKPQNGGSPLPAKMTYVISDSTGAFANAGGKGSISIAIDATANTFIIVIH